MKLRKIFILIITGVIILTGCTSQSFKKYYNNMSIPKGLESYQLDLRIYGKINDESINKTYKIDNFKNEKYKVTTTKDIYYLSDGETYKNSNFRRPSDSKLERVSEAIFHDTDLILKGLTNVKTKKAGTNDIDGTEYVVYDVTFKDKFINELLKSLELKYDFKEATGKIYINQDKVYKISYKIDDLTINGSYFRLNNINENIFNIDDIKINNE